MGGTIYDFLTEFGVENSGTVIPLWNFQSLKPEIPLYTGIQRLIPSRIAPMRAHRRMCAHE